MNENNSERAKRILGEAKIDLFTNESKIIEILNKISEGENESSELEEKILDNIEDYLFTKEKMQVKKEDYKYLKNLSEKLSEQEVRRSDSANPPLFKISNNEGKDIYFITRDGLDKYKECNKELKYKIVEIPESNSTELAHTLEIIKRIFS